MKKTDPPPKKEEKSGHSEAIDILRGSHFCPFFKAIFVHFLKKTFSLGLWHDDFTIDCVEIEPLSTIGRFFISLLAFSSYVAHNSSERG